MSFGRMGGMGRGFGHLGSPLGGAPPSPPAGFIFLQLSDGRYDQDAQGNYILVRI